jgi:hypothetical protein
MDEFAEGVTRAVYYTVWIIGCGFWFFSWIEVFHSDVMRVGYAQPETYVVAALGVLWYVGGFNWLNAPAKKQTDNGAAYRAAVENQNAHGEARLASAQEFNGLNNARSPLDQYKF